MKDMYKVKAQKIWEFVASAIQSSETELIMRWFETMNKQMIWIVYHYQENKITLLKMHIQ